MAVKVGSARSSYGNTAAGDQHKGLEVSTQNWYLHSKGWVLLRAKDATARERLALAMERACANNNIGYDQNTRNSLYANVKDRGFDPALTTKKVNTDCSALVRVCMAYAGIPVEDFITSTQAARLMATGKFEKFTDSKYTRSSDYLLRGDILVTKTKGHTVIVLSNGAKAAADKPVSTGGAELGSRVLKNGMEGEDVKALQSALISLGYDCGRWGADGDFGDATEIAVRAFQKEHGCKVDGQAGSETLKALEAAQGTAEESAGAKHVEITGGNCYVRAEPSTGGSILGVAKAGEKLAYLGEDSENGWHKVTYGSANGWVSGKYSRLEK